MSEKKGECEKRIEEEITRLEGIKSAIGMTQDKLRDAKRECRR